MFCPKCGAQNSEVSKFCKNCGSELIQNGQNPSFQNKKTAWHWGNGIYVIGLALVVLAFYFAGAFGGRMDLAGMWSATDGSTKIFNSNGTCAVGMGDGPQSYTLSGGADSNGRYALRITRPFDAFTLYIKDDGGGKMSVYNESGKFLWTMTKK